MGSAAAAGAAGVGEAEGVAGLDGDWVGGAVVTTGGTTVAGVADRLDGTTGTGTRADSEGDWLGPAEGDPVAGVEGVWLGVVEGETEGDTLATNGRCPCVAV